MDITLVLTRNCNLRCDYCYAGDKVKESMTWETAKRSLDFAWEQFPEAQKNLGFFGGEPLLEWELLQRTTDYFDGRGSAKGNKPNKTLTTNGSLLNEDRMKWLVDRNFYLGISLDGNEKSHDLLRHNKNGEGSYQSCLPGLELFLKHKAKGAVITVVDPKNLPYLNQGIVDLYSRGVRRLSLNLNIYTPWSRMDLHRLKTFYRRLVDFHFKCVKSKDPIEINTINNKVLSAIKGPCKDRKHCDFGGKSITVAPSGNIYPCDRIVGNDDDLSMRMGHVHHGFDKKNRKRILDQRGNITEQCQNCDYRERCSNYCGCMNYLSTGYINQVDGVLCFHERTLIRLVDKKLFTSGAKH